MRYKDEFGINGTDDYISQVLPHRKRESGMRIGEMIARDYSHTTNGDGVYKIEVFVTSEERLSSFYDTMQENLSPAQFGILKAALKDLFGQP